MPGVTTRRPADMHPLSMKVSATGWKRKLFGSTAIPALLLPVRAHGAEGTLIPAMSFTSTEIIMLAVFGGAMSFALLSASWLIRDRSRILGENTKFRHRLAGLRAVNDRLEALVSAPDQRVITWSSDAETPAVMGALAKTAGAPDDEEEFLAFGRWLKADSAVSFEGVLKRLRQHAEVFGMPLITRSGGVLEAQGRTSGSHAFVRFIELTGERMALARMEAEHAHLLANFASVQALFEKLPLPVWLRDPAGALYWVNSAYAKAVDGDDKDAVVEAGTELLDSAQRREVTRAQRENAAFSGRIPAVIAGDRRLLDVTEVRTEAGLAGIAIDRDEIETVRATLKQTIAGHAQTLDHLATAIAMFDERQQLKFYNSSFQKLWELPESLLQSAPSNTQVLEAMRAEDKLPEVPDWRKWREQQLEIYRALEPREDWWYLPNGQTLRVVVNPHNQGGATWVFENVTEHLALQSSYNALMRIQGETLDHLDEAVAVFGSDGKLKLFNPALLHIWKLGEDAIAPGLHISALARKCSALTGDGSEWDDITAAITGFEDQRGNLAGRLEKVDGEVVDYSLVRLPDGQTMLAFVDITAAVNIERALKERNEALEQSDHLKSRFIQHVSYELRAPLTSISGFAELLGMHALGKLNEKQDEYVANISSASDTLKNIVDDILDLATVDAGSMTLDIAPIDLAAVVGDCLHELDEEMNRRGIGANTSIGVDKFTLQADEHRLRRIVENLLTNAVRFSPDGGTVTVEARRAGSAIEIAVSDQGPGVPEQYRESIFGRFESRASGDRRRGAGLGLSIVKAFVELHGGTVHVEDAGKRGARFVCRFALEAGQDSKAA